MGGWATGKNSFQANPPNAAIVHGALKTNEKGIAQAIPVELTNPVASSAGWTFHMKDIQGKISTGYYNRIDLFVDPSFEIPYMGSYFPPGLHILHN